MEILFVTLVEEYLVVVEISVVIINHESDYSLIYPACSMPVFEAQDILSSLNNCSARVYSDR